jgi:hypothetical protein
VEKELCEHCTFIYACCLGDPKYKWAVDKKGILCQQVVHCNSFIESSESLEEND